MAGSSVKRGSRPAGRIRAVTPQIPPPDLNPLTPEDPPVAPSRPLPDVPPPDAVPAPAEPQMPSQTVAAVIEWVGGDRGRASAALVAERRRAKPRSKLLTALNALLAADG